MIENITESSVAGIIAPGEMYVFSDDYTRVWNYGSLEYIFFIKDESELLQALEMKFFITHAGIYDWVMFLRIYKINEKCHQLQFEYTSKAFKRKSILLLYLHRIPPFPEYLAESKKLLEEKEIFEKTFVRK